MDSSVKGGRKPNPRENAFPLSACTFSYTIPLFIKGYKRDLVESDLTETLTEHKSSNLGNKIEAVWKKEEEKAAKAKRTPSLFRVLWKVFGLELMTYGFVLLFTESIRVAQPILLGEFLKYYMPDTKNDMTKKEAYLYATGVVLCSLINVCVTHPYMMGVLHLGMKIRVACCSLIYRKSLRLSKTALGETTIGQVVNLLSNDVNRFDIGLIMIHNLWVGPIQTVICTYLMYLHVEMSAVYGVLFLIMFIPLQMYLGKRVSVTRLKTALRTDERVRLMNEIISGIQVIKMYAWEKPFAQLIALCRRMEIKQIRAASYMRGITLSFIMFTTRLAIFASIVSYVLLDHNLTPEKVFVLTSFYNILRQTMTVFFPQGVTQAAETRVSIKRLNKFLLYDEIDQEQYKRNNVALNGEAKINVTAEKPGVYIQDGLAKWIEGNSEYTLNNINLNAIPGKLVAVIGPVGSGKTSLLQAILKELPLISGNLQVNGIVSYASQEPWLFAGTVRQNILFGLPMDKLRYKTVIKKCSLERDFTLLPFGDKTIVGDRGVSLSGGQRARINLARAVYKKADIYLLDDPLSAVDTHVGKELFDNCIRGYLRDKTVILVTHQLQYLKHVEQIVFLEDGIIKHQGTYQELQKSGINFMLESKDEDEDADKKSLEEESELERQGSIRSVSSIEGAPAVEEHMSKGSVSAAVYLNYFKAGGNWCIISLLIMLFMGTQLFASLVDYFTTFWLNIEQRNAQDRKLQRHHEQRKFNITIHDMRPKAINNDDDFWNFSRDTCIIVYSVLISILIVITLTRTFSFFKICMRASTRLHDNLFRSVIHATMRFFNTNPGGRILNRFSKDMGSVDELLTSCMIDTLQIGLSLLGAIVVIAAINPILMVPTCLAGVIFYFLRLIYIKTSRNIKRLEGVTRSPVFSHLSASLQGLTTIRAFGAQQVLEKEFDNHQDLHSSAWFNFISTSRAFGYWLDSVCILYILAVTYSFLLFGDEKYGGNVGLAITQAISLTGMFQWGMRQSTELENQMTSVERILEYNNLEMERDMESKKETKPPASWPEAGEIIFKHVFLRYFPDDPPVLRDLTFKIQAGEKIGIVGRTGAGKSSIITAIFQLTDTEGVIEIDNINIGTIGLHDLRSKISIIPQEPVLFSATIRKNLDPFDEFTDDALWKALEAVELKEAVTELPAGLSSKMSEGGSNFSVGQRQLVCLARAILRNNKILVLDEATANIDPRTDTLIQTTIRQKFGHCTVLTIAHRLHTVMDSDKILVMDAGMVQEYDHPYKLLQNEFGTLTSMVNNTGDEMSATLKKVAEECWLRSSSSEKKDV